MKVAVLGYGIEGQSAARYWSGKGHDVTICDGDPKLKVPADYRSRLGSNYLTGLDGFDMVVRSQSVNPASFKTVSPITSVTDEFLKQCKAPVIGVTGTKGKGTTASLITEILRASGKTVHLGGNIGISPLDFLDEAQDHHLVVLEMSSFQLVGISRSPQVAVMLMISPDHMDWHSDMAEYGAAKANIFKYQTPDDIAVYNCSNVISLRLGQKSAARHVPYNSESGAWVDGDTVKFQETAICKTAEVGLIGRHNLENVCAAIAATWELTKGNIGATSQTLQGFKGLEHRLEYAGERRGVKFYDDSFSTNPETAMAAIRAFDQPKVIILGGSDKRASYETLAGEIARSNVRQVILIGDTAPKIQAALESAGFRYFKTGGSRMPQIVQAAFKAAKEGDVVLLSPASASFGLFQNYKDRGRQFKQAVAGL